jgi:hypothetical protein
LRFLSSRLVDAYCYSNLLPIVIKKRVASLRLSSIHLLASFPVGKGSSQRRSVEFFNEHRSRKSSTRFSHCFLDPSQSRAVVCSHERQEQCLVDSESKRGSSRFRSEPYFGKAFGLIPPTCRRIARRAFYFKTAADSTREVFRTLTCRGKHRPCL